MKSLGQYLAIPKFLLLTIAAMYSLESAAQGISITNGYVCAPKNIGGEETRLFFRQQDGIAENLSQTATFPVVCPVVISYDDAPYFVRITVGQSSNVGQNFACSLEEYDLYHNKVRGIGKSVFLAPNSGDVIAWEGIFLSNVNNYLSLRCILPPRGGIAAVSWF